MITAHPAKFNDCVEEAIQSNVDLPASLLQALNKKKKAISLSKSFANFKAYCSEQS